MNRPSLHSDTMLRVIAQTLPCTIRWHVISSLYDIRSHDEAHSMHSVSVIIGKIEYGSIFSIRTSCYGGIKDTLTVCYSIRDLCLTIRHT